MVGQGDCGLPDYAIIKKGFQNGSLPSDVTMAWSQCRNRWSMPNRLNHSARVKRAYFCQVQYLHCRGSFQWNRWRVALFLLEKMAFSSIFWLQTNHASSKEKAGLTMSSNSRWTQGSIFRCMSVQIVLGFYRPSLKTTMSLVGCPNYIAEGCPVNDTSKKPWGPSGFNVYIPFIYQGQEIGWKPSLWIGGGFIIATIKLSCCERSWFERGRSLSMDYKYSWDNARTPMQWSSRARIRFSDGTAWLISPKPNVAINVEDQIPLILN